MFIIRVERFRRRRDIKAEKSIVKAKPGVEYKYKSDVGGLAEIIEIISAKNGAKW